MGDISLSRKKGCFNFGIALLLMVSMFLIGLPVHAETSNVTGNITVSPDSINYGETATVTMNLTGVAGISQNPADVMLVLDRSGSMGQVNLAKLKTAANQFISILDRETDGQLDGVIGNGSRIGIVTFHSAAELKVGLINNVPALRNIVNSISLGGNTNHADAFTDAQTVLSSSKPENQKIMVMFTDGAPTVPSSNPVGAATTAATAAKDAGTEIYTIGLGNLTNSTVANLKAWATDEQHYYGAPTADQLDAIFSGIGATIVTPAATNISINNTINNNFTVSDVSATKGTATMTGNEIQWNVDSLVTETITLTYKLHPTENANGTISVSDAITYSDNEGQTVNFGIPVLEVIGLDRVAPVTEAVLSGSDQNGWYNQDVSVELNATDDRSGVERTEYQVNGDGWKPYHGAFTVGAERENSVQFRSTDHAGNVEDTKSVVVKIDKTAPTLNLSFNEMVITSKNHKLVPITAFVDANDSVSGIERIELVSIESNQPDNGKGDGNTEDDIQGAELGTYDTDFLLRGERSGGNGDRIYTVTYKVTDKAGNTTFATREVVVKHNNSKK